MVAHNGAFGWQKRRPAGRYRPNTAPRDPIEARLTLLNETGDRRFWLSARALVFRAAGRWQRPLAIRDMRRVSTGERRPQFFKAWQVFSFRWTSHRDAMFHPDEEPEVRRSTHPLAAMHFGPTDTQTALGNYF